MQSCAICSEKRAVSEISCVSVLLLLLLLPVAPADEDDWCCPLAAIVSLWLLIVHGHREGSGLAGIATPQVVSIQREL
uniref:Putative secreted protein n=1 Tax=Anopheles darlingi TaxID=43151 RepID=A0A2M4D2A2_ANODA